MLRVVLESADEPLRKIILTELESGEGKFTVDKLLTVFKFQQMDRMRVKQ